MRRRLIMALGVTAILGSGVVVPLTSAAPDKAVSNKTAKVTVGDDYFAPTDVTIKKGQKVQWVWSSDNLDTHNVYLTSKHPKGVKASDFRSSSGAIGLKFKRKFTKPGTYGFICTYHRTVMKVNLKVKR